MTPLWKGKAASPLLSPLTTHCRQKNYSQKFTALTCLHFPSKKVSISLDFKAKEKKKVLEKPASSAHLRATSRI